MNQKKTMKLWQMLVIMIVTLVMIVTMFMPAIKINGNAFVKGMESVTGGSALGKMIAEMSDLDADQAREELDQEIKDFEEENGSKISSISPFNIMTHNIIKLIGGTKMTEEDVREAEERAKEDKSLSSLTGGYGKIRIVLWIVYMMGLIVLLLTIIGFAARMNKFIPLIISTIYGVAAAIIFGYLRFGLAGSIAKKIIAFTGADLSSDMGWEVIMGGMVGNATEDIFKKFLSAFCSIAFLIALIAAVLLIVMSVLSMILGNRVEEDFEEYDVPDYADDFEDERGFNRGMGSGMNMPSTDMTEAFFQPQPIKMEESVVTAPVTPAMEVKPVAQVQQPKMGQVKCTKGTAVGQGFMLPQDRKVIVGKSPMNANLVIHNQNVSNVHCSIRYNAAANTYIIKDHSMNGTFVNGVRLQKDVPMEYPAGTVLSLADGSNEITLG